MRIYCVGIGGIGLSAVASILRLQGHEVSGADSSESSITERLRNEGIQIFIGHDEDQLQRETDFVIYSEAVPPNNPERMKAADLGIEQMNYAQALGRLSQDYKTVAISGTHGKTTSTGMLVSILKAAGIQPTVVIGSKLDQLGNRNFTYGEGEIFVAEACEYRENFLTLSPYLLLINNLEPDHLDYFGSDREYFEAFQKLSEKVPEGGTVLIRKSDLDKLNRDSIKASVQLLPESPEKTYLLMVPGKHNQANAQAAAALAALLGVSEEKIQEGLQNFKGTWRRFELKGELNGAPLIDDYGHHPTEVKATIQAARERYPDHRLTVLFQPHQHSRTRLFFEDFSKAFNEADEVVITDIYEARDTDADKEAVSAQRLAAAINTPVARYLPLKDLAQYIHNKARPKELFLVMGAGNISQIFADPQLSCFAR